MVHLFLLRASNDLGLNCAETIQDDSCRRPRSRVLGNTLDRELSEFGRTARIRKPAHFLSINGKRRCGAGKVIVICELAGRDFCKDDTEGEDVGGKVKFVAEEDLGGHVCVCPTEGEAPGLFLVAGGDAGESKVGDLEATVGGHEEILAFEVAVDAFASVKVGEGTGNVGCKGKSETPGQRLGFGVDILTEVT